jgi:disulfide bond formation protein DsbB
MELSNRAFAGLVLIASAAVLGTALGSQYWGGLAPCELCILQRWPWSVAITICIVALFAGGRSGLSWLALVLAVVFLVGVGFGLYHVAVEQHWIAGPAACTSPSGNAASVEELRRQILGQAPVLCDRPAWTLFGVSMAGWNVLASLVMAAFCFIVFRRARRPRHRPA